jgi:hypothetical protein
MKWKLGLLHSLAMKHGCGSGVNTYTKKRVRSVGLVCTWLLGPNLVWIRYGNFSALLYTALKETCWRMKTTGVPTAMLSTVVTLICSCMQECHFQLTAYTSILSFFSEQSHSLCLYWKVPSFRMNLLRPSSGLFLFGWEDRVIEFATKLCGVTFQKTVVIFCSRFSGLSYSSRHFSWRSVANYIHVASWRNQI